MNQKDFVRLLEKYENGKCSEKELELIDRFYHILEQKDSKWDNLSSNTSEQIKTEIKGRIKEHIKPESTIISTRWQFWKVAASILLVIGISFLLYKFIDSGILSPYVTETTSNDQKNTYILNDGSLVILNNGSSLTYPKKFDPEIRAVVLSGEAFFDVSPDPQKPFIIKTEKLTTTVLGTSFNIRAYPGESKSEITVETGKVRVEQASEGSHRTEVLTPNMRAVYDKSTEKIAVENLDHQLAWKEDRIFLEGKTLFETTRILEKWYEAEFIFENDNIKKCVINGGFRKDSLDNIMKNIQFITGIEYRIEYGNKIFMSGIGCNSKNRKN